MAKNLSCPCPLLVLLVLVIHYKLVPLCTALRCQGSHAAAQLGSTGPFGVSACNSIIPSCSAMCISAGNDFCWCAGRHIVLSPAFLYVHLLVAVELSCLLMTSSLRSSSYDVRSTWISD